MYKAALVTQCVPPVLQVKESHGRGEPLPRPEPLPLWGGDDAGRGRAARGDCGGCFGHSSILGCSALFQSQASVEGVFLIEMKHGLSPTVCKRTATTTTTACVWDG